MHSVLCVAGLDPSGHAGLSADFRALNFLGIRCLPVVSTLTVQNRGSFSESHPVSPELIVKQLEAIFDAEEPDAVKLGVLGCSDIANSIADFLTTESIPVVTDPVFDSSTGFRFADDAMIEDYRRRIIPLSRIVTPNAPEASIISGVRVENPGDASVACEKIFGLGPGSVLLKGGHFKESTGTDVFYDSSGPHILDGEELFINLRGTGCAYSSLIAGHIALGMSTLQAVRMAKKEMGAALSTSERTGILIFGHGYGKRPDASQNRVNRGGAK